MKYIMKLAYLSPSAVILFLALFYRPEWVLFLLFVGAAVVVITFAISAFIGAHLKSLSKIQRKQVKSQDLEALRNFFTQVDPKPVKPRRLPVIFGRMIDDALQHLLDLVLRDFICNALNSIGLSTEELSQEIKEDMWKVVSNLQERMSKVDPSKLVAVDIVCKVTKHFEMIRKVQIMEDEEKAAYHLPPHVLSVDKERAFLRKFTENAMELLFPQGYTETRTIKLLLRELITCKVLHPAIEIITDPDYINQRILLYIQHQAQKETIRKKSYTYAPSFQDFLKMIKETDDPEVLKHIRYNIVTEIIQATKIQSLKSSTNLAQTKDIFGHIGSKIDLGLKLQARQMKRYMNQLTYAKAQCEKRLVSLGWTDYAVEEAVEAATVEARKMLSLHEVLGTVVGREHLMQYLEQVGSKALLSYWNAVEELRQAKRSDLHQLGTEIFYTYINTPSPEIRVDKPILKRMEAFLLGDTGPEVFYEVQAQILANLEEKIFPSFIVSDVYPKMLLAMENHDETDEAVDASLLDSDDTSDVTDSMDSGTLEIADQSSYARKKIDEIQQKLNNKMQALEALRSSLKPESKVLATLESEVESLQGEKRQLEAHLSRTEAWSEHLGRWRAVVQSAELSEDRECPQFVLVVHVMEDESDCDAVSTGWVVLRKLNDFQDLHKKLCQLSSDVKQLELPSQSLTFLRFGKTSVKNALEKARQQIQKYLKFVLEDDRLNQSEALYAFLSPSSEHLKHIAPSPRRSKFSLSTLFKIGSDHSPETTPASGGTGRESGDEEVTLLLDNDVGNGQPNRGVGPLAIGDTAALDGIAEPLYRLLEELFDPGMFRWLRKTLIMFVQITYNKSINRQVCETVTWLFSESMIYYYIQIISKAWWPNDKLIAPSSPKTEEQKLETRSAAREELLNNIPDFLSTLVGQQCAQRGMSRVFEALQDQRLNKKLFYDIFEVVVHELCPEWKQQ
ncbi:sorting nexin-25 [Schistocerca americana]|uniref:sorting nexin-25 n=1 Tax=Schistocerca americana TaxID=7009 RepID=UPI001F4F150A|nr:sorting nexin-25 [Schistocerca americana]XP_049959109.1 sorting nexin-25 [Schistocerca serialis cubense]